MMKVNYHTHTKRCHHAYGNDEEYVKAAIEAGFKVLGFSDHTPWKYNDKSFVSGVRMTVEEFDNYYDSLNELKEKYADQIKILIGLEAEYFPEYIDWYKKFIKEKNIDYVIFGNHYSESDEYGMYYGYACNDDNNLFKYLQDIKDGVNEGIYSYVAHPDLFMRGRNKFDKVAEKVSQELCEFCKEKDMPLEYNLGGLRVMKQSGIVEYPHPKFWEIAAKVGNKAIIGVDAHSPNDLLDEALYNEAKATLESLGLEIIDTIELKKFEK